MKESSKSEASPGLQCETENSVRIFEIRVCAGLGHLFDDQPSKRSFIHLAIKETKAWIKQAQAWVIGPLYQWHHSKPALVKKRQRGRKSQLTGKEANYRNSFVLGTRDVGQWRRLA